VKERHEYVKVVLVTGDRNWTDREKIRGVLTDYDPLTTLIVEGGARGADTIAREVAEELGFDVLEVKADWERYGRAAGPVRNKLMYDKSHPDVVEAFHGNIGASKGTKHMVEYSKKGGTPVRVTT
jgi:8-oxo-dGTP pyrophosphatase MutT (NUDIX family)